MGEAHVPTNITLTENADGSWSVLSYWDSYYAEDIKTFFPADCVEDALDSQKYIYSQMQACYSQAVERAGLDTDQIISDLLDVICAEPLESSKVSSYLEANPIAYRELLYYGDYTLDYCKRYLNSLGLEDDGTAEYGLRRAIREAVLERLKS